MKKTLLLIAGLTLGSSMAWAHGDEHHMDEHMSGSMAHNPCSMHTMKSMNPCDMKGMKKGMFLKKKVIDGYEVSFHIMKAPEGMAKGGTHHLMVKVVQNGKVVGLQAVNSKVTYPNDKSESKMMMKMGDWYMSSYDLGHAGEHKIMILFKTTDGQKHFGGIAYPSK